MKFLVTGSNGLLGQKLIYRLLEKKYETIAFALGPNRMKVQTGYTYLNADITHKEQVHAAIEKNRPDVIIHSAAMTNVDACETEKEKCWAANVLSVEHFILAIKSVQAKNAQYNPHFIFLSTDFVFDGENGPYKEDDKPNPLSYYSNSKWEGEKRVIASGLKWSIARTIIIYGIVDNMSRSNMVLWVKTSLEKGQSINVVDDQFRSPTLAEDLAEGCILIAEKEKTGIFHLSGPETKSIYDLAKDVAGFWKLDATLIKPIKTASLGQPAARPPRTGFILDKARKELGYSPKTFNQGLEFLKRQLAER
ncbi:MAG: SDR family oxidoreductase [Flavobacteriales bacterium]